MDNIKLGHIDRGNNALMGLARGLQNVIYLRAKMGQVRLKHRLLVRIKEWRASLVLWGKRERNGKRCETRC